MENSFSFQTQEKFSVFNLKRINDFCRQPAEETFKTKVLSSR